MEKGCVDRAPTAKSSQEIHWRVHLKNILCTGEAERCVQCQGVGGRGRLSALRTFPPTSSESLSTLSGNARLELTKQIFFIEFSFFFPAREMSGHQQIWQSNESQLTLIYFKNRQMLERTC